MTVRTLPSVPVPYGIKVADMGESVYRDPEGRKIRLCKNEHKDAILYRITETERGSLLAEIAQEAAALLGSHLILRWLDLPGFFLEHDALFLHASFVRWQDKAILFTGRKQIGKSTQAELWRRFRGAEIVNGDRALLRRIDGVWTAFGSPFCGTSDICVNAQAPLAAVVLLNQGPENRIAPADQKAAYSAFLSGCSYDPQNRDAVECVVTLAEQLHREIPMLRLYCTPDLRAVACLEEALRGEWKNG